MNTLKYEREYFPGALMVVLFPSVFGNRVKVRVICILKVGFIEAKDLSNIKSTAGARVKDGGTACLCKKNAVRRKMLSVRLYIHAHSFYWVSQEDAEQLNPSLSSSTLAFLSV